MSDSFEDFPPARATDDYMTTAEINEAIRIRHTDPEPNIAWMQSRILELEAKQIKPVWADRLSLIPHYLKRLNLTVDFDTMSLRITMAEDNVQAWQRGILLDKALKPMFSAVGLDIKYSEITQNYILVEL